MKELLKDKVNLINKKNGNTIKGIDASVNKNKIIIFDSPNFSIEVGDIIERTMSNNITECYEVTNTVFYEEFGCIPAHYQIYFNKKQ